MHTKSFVGLDVHKASIAISIAEDKRSAPVRFIGVIPNTPDDVAKMAKRLARDGELDFCYEAGGCGYGIHRQLPALGYHCLVVAPSMIPRKPGERIKTDRRDSEKLAAPAACCVVLDRDAKSGRTPSQYRQEERGGERTIPEDSTEMFWISSAF